MHKLGVPGPDRFDDDEIEHVHAAVYHVENGRRLRAGVPYGSPVSFEALTISLTPPYMLLYVLHTTHGEAEPGRYQSPELSKAEFQSFIHRFCSYLGSDARFDIWARSQADDATVVWDRHNFLYAYGPIESFKTTLNTLGFVEGEVEALGAHVHHYRTECDNDARAMIQAFDWMVTPLQPQDEQ